jgi:hypothetical protein
MKSKTSKNKSMAIDWSGIFKKHKGLWVALKKNERTVVAAGRTAKEAWDKARAQGYAKPILTRVPEKIIPYIGSTSL